MKMPTNTPLTLEALEGILGRRNEGDKLFGKLEEMSTSIGSVNREVGNINNRLTQAEEADKRHEKSAAEYAAKLEALRAEISELKLATAVDRVKLSTIVAGATLIISGLVSWIVNYIMKTPAKP
jgi:phage host-nuclease inhibitor protein Gam